MRFRSLASINQCISTLTDAIDNEPLLYPRWRGRRPVVGAIHGHEFRIRKRQSFYYNNNLYASIFYGTFREELTGTRIEGHFSIHPVTMVALIVWFVCTIGILGPVSYATGTPIIFWFFLVVSAGVIWFPLLRGLSDRKYLRDFLERTLKAHCIDVNNA